jgi:hypothetical protein
VTGSDRRRALAVLVDGAPMPESDARAFWQRFSDWMEEHRGDLAGFAASEGFASVHPGVAAGHPVLHVSRSVAQRPYGPVSGGAGSVPSRSGGSQPRHREVARPRPGGHPRAKPRGKRQR